MFSFSQPAECRSFRAGATAQHQRVPLSVLKDTKRMFLVPIQNDLNLPTEREVQQQLIFNACKMVARTHILHQEDSFSAPLTESQICSIVGKTFVGGDKNVVADFLTETKGDVSNNDCAQQHTFCDQVNAQQLQRISARCAKKNQNLIHNWAHDSCDIEKSKLNGRNHYFVRFVHHCGSNKVVFETDLEKSVDISFQPQCIFSATDLQKAANLLAPVPDNLPQRVISSDEQFKVDIIAKAAERRQNGRSVEQIDADLARHVKFMQKTQWGSELERQISARFRSAVVSDSSDDESSYESFSQTDSSSYCVENTTCTDETTDTSLGSYESCDEYSSESVSYLYSASDDEDSESDTYSYSSEELVTTVLCESFDKSNECGVSCQKSDQSESYSCTDSSDASKSSESGTNTSTDYDIQLSVDSYDTENIVLSDRTRNTNTNADTQLYSHFFCYLSDPYCEPMHVAVVGSFCNWNVAQSFELEMIPKINPRAMAVFVGTMQLPAGNYDYKYVIDGVVRVCPRSFVTTNSNSEKVHRFTVNDLQTLYTNALSCSNEFRPRLLSDVCPNSDKHASCLSRKENYDEDAMFMIDRSKDDYCKHTISVQESECDSSDQSSDCGDAIENNANAMPIGVAAARQCLWETHSEISLECSSDHLYVKEDLMSAAWDECASLPETQTDFDTNEQQLDNLYRYLRPGKALIDLVAQKRNERENLLSSTDSTDSDFEDTSKHQRHEIDFALPVCQANDNFLYMDQMHCNYVLQWSPSLSPDGQSKSDQKRLLIWRKFKQLKKNSWSNFGQKKEASYFQLIAVIKAHV